MILEYIIPGYLNIIQQVVPRYNADQNQLTTQASIDKYNIEDKKYILFPISILRLDP